jgi:hypothetical protein
MLDLLCVPDSAWRSSSSRSRAWRFLCCLVAAATTVYDDCTVRVRLRHQKAVMSLAFVPVKRHVLFELFEVVA